MQQCKLDWTADAACKHDANAGRTFFLVRGVTSTTSSITVVVVVVVVVVAGRADF